MATLRQWIEAQLKKGYTKEQVKHSLIRRGYLPSAVAEVDKISYSIQSNKNLSRKIPPKIIALASIAILIMLWMFGAETFLKDPCKGFPEIEGEVSCKDAVKTALTVYPGKVKGIAKTQISRADIDNAQIPPPDTGNMQTGDAPLPSAIPSTERNAWLIKISLKEAIKLPIGESKEIEAAVDMVDKTLTLYQFSKE